MSQFAQQHQIDHQYLEDQQYLVITALGRDRPGIVNTITRLVSQHGCNIEDSRLAIFGGEFTFIMMLSGSWNAIAMLESTLPIKGAQLDLLIVMKRTSCGETATYYPSTVSVHVEVDDAPGLVERFTNLFMTMDFNLAELISKTHPTSLNHLPKLEIQITAHNPMDDNGLIIKEKFAALCAELNAEGTIKVLDNQVKGLS